MKIFPTSGIRQLDAYTIEHEPIASIDLMERAARALADAIMEQWPDTETPFTVFAGPGNNGGDALAVARLMAGQGYRPRRESFPKTVPRTANAFWRRRASLSMKSPPSLPLPH